MQQEHSGNDELDDRVRQGVLLLLRLAVAGLAAQPLALIITAL